MPTITTWGLASVLVGSFVVCILLVLTQRWHGRLSLDHDILGVQKIHARPVPRIGGLGLAFGLLIASVISYAYESKTYLATLMLLCCAMPVFIAGLLEDLTKKVGIRTRFIASFVAAALAVWVLDARLVKLDTFFLDSLMQIPALSVVFTIFAVAGVTHSINIVDGLNGLAAGAVAIMLAGLATMAWMHGDMLVMRLCLWGIASTAGFLLLNYPFGRIFLGDGGAYLAGFWLAQCAVLLLYRNPSISTWAVLLACIYPVWETIFSILRRMKRGRNTSGQADLEHLHQLIFKSLQESSRRGAYVRRDWFRHGVASAGIWLVIIACQAVAILVDDAEAVLPVAAGTYAAGYWWMYRLLAAKSDSHTAHPPLANV